MNKRGKKKAEKKKRAAVHKILDAVLDLNGLGCRSVDKTGNLPTAFFDFSGHVALLKVYVYRDGWDFGKKSSVSLSLNTDTCSDEDIERFLLKMEHALK